MTLVVGRGVGLRDDKGLLAVGREEIQMVADLALVNLPVRRFEEAKIVDAGERCQRRDRPMFVAFSGVSIGQMRP